LECPDCGRATKIINLTPVLSLVRRGGDAGSLRENFMKKFISIFLLLAIFLMADAVLAKAEQANPQGQNGPGVLTGLNQEVEEEPEDNDNDQNGQKNQNNEENKGQNNAALHRSVVAAFVQKLLQVANREGGIGEQVRLIAQQQNQGATTTAQVVEKVEKRNKIKTFLIGTDYKNLGALRSEMVQTRNRLEQLTQLREKAKTEADKLELQNQIQTMMQEQARIENFIKAQEGKFSLFGWLVKLFNK